MSPTLHPISSRLSMLNLMDREGWSASEAVLYLSYTVGAARTAWKHLCSAGWPSSIETAPASIGAVSYTHLRAHETPEHLVCRLLLEKKKKQKKEKIINRKLIRKK
eukprot:TRINITY_DN4042_c0_g1_i3.p2 TRINITY_DN4042_c0_g1~~TRINITY_DN4042_c0_g1_i3.p2  ORF type:complete len:106 (+),score=13.02 TRINITY_DN4042_c0_g1_i3:700-1017(+)